MSEIYYSNGNGNGNGHTMRASSAGPNPYGDDYMQQEEEWEREGLLDPLWEKQQKKVRELNIKDILLKSL